MRRLTIVALQFALAGGAPCATFDVDGDLMRGIDDTAKSLDSDVAQKDAKAALDLSHACNDCHDAHKPFQ